MNDQSTPEISIADRPMSRRGVLRVGGLTVTLTAIASACVDEAVQKEPARVGFASPPPTLLDAVVTDGVLMRTATSMHYSFIDSHNISKKLGALDAAQTAIIDAYIAANEESIQALQKLSEAAGSKQWTCANPRFDRVILGPIQDRITGRPKLGSEEIDVPPSDDPTRDCLALAHAMETVSASMHQSFVPQLSLPTYRSAVMLHGQAAARRAAALALAINPDNMVDPDDVENATISAPTTTAPTTTAATTTTAQDIGQDSSAATTTTVFVQPIVFQEYYAIPSQFGALNAFQLAVGQPSAGAQFTINVETPSLNSLVYDYQTEC